MYSERVKCVVTATQTTDLLSCLKPGEGEFLFAPYSVFTVRKVNWSKDETDPHHITIAASLDNSLEPDDLPLAPW